jgi:hypothetical protein
MDEQYTVEDFLNYITGWLGADSVNTNRLSISEMRAALLNANSMLEDSQDGIESFVERMTYDELNPEDWSMD